MEFKSISPAELKENVFQLIGRNWMLVTAKNSAGKVNTMTASWGGVGVLWGENVAFVFIRPQRYTLKFVDDCERFTLSFLPEQYRKQLNYCGTVSGRDENKIARCGFTLAGEPPYFAESDLVLTVKKLYCQRLDESRFLDKNIILKWYPQFDYHYMFVCGIEEVLKKGE